MIPGTADKLSPFLATSAALHMGLFALVVFGPILFPKPTGVSWGNSSVKEGIAVSTAPSLPGVRLPSPPVVQENAKLTDSKTLHPAEAVTKTSPKAPPKPAEIKIPERGATKTTKPEAAASNVAKADVPLTPSPTANAIPGTGGQVAIPYGTNGAGQATFGGDGTFGTRFPEYVTAMTTAIKSAWQKPVSTLTQGASQRVYVTFTINKRGGSAVATDIQIDQASGSPQLDRSASRAIAGAALPPLPRDYSGSSVDVRFYFDYTR